MYKIKPVNEKKGIKVNIPKLVSLCSDNISNILKFQNSSKY